MRHNDIQFLMWLLLRHLGSARQTISDLFEHISSSWYCIEELLETGKRAHHAIADEDGICRAHHRPEKPWCIMITTVQFRSSHGTKNGLHVRRSLNR